MKTTTILSIGLLLAACAQQPDTSAAVTTSPTSSAAPAPTDPLAKLSAFTIADLQNADAIAVANNDALAAALEKIADRVRAA